MPKLTLSADREIIDKAKELAKQQRTSVSALFAQFINAATRSDHWPDQPAPITRRCKGLAKVSADKTDRQLFEEAIAEKAHR